MIVRLIRGLRFLGVLALPGGLYLIFGEGRVVLGILVFVVGSIVGAWAHGIITRALSRPVTREEAERWLQGK